jgi:RNA polymerase sigma-54 factor
VTVEASPDGGWTVELNPDALPRVLFNRTYYEKIAGSLDKQSEEHTFLSECLQNANWLTRSLDQRARTIMKVATEIVRQQDAFLAHGIEHLRPLNLKTVADAIKMHESTVSRVTSNKYRAASSNSSTSSPSRWLLPAVATRIRPRRCATGSAR